MSIPDGLHELIEWELAVAYHQGYRAALADVAAGQAELDAAWRPVGRRGHERAVAERVAEMRRCARRLRAELDRADAERARAERGDASRAGPRGADPGRPRGADPGWPPVAVPGRCSRRPAAA